MKIVIYQPRCSYYVGGGEIIPLQQAELFAKKGHQVVLVTLRSHKLQQSDHFQLFIANNSSIEVVFIEVDKSLEYIYNQRPGENRFRWNNESIHIARQALPILASIDADFYVAHNVLDAIALPVGKKCIVHLHGYPEELNYAYQLALSYGYKYIAVSNYVREKWLGMLNLDRINVIYNGIV